MTTARRALPLGWLALVAYVPLLRTQPGWVGADTKHYLYLDPGRLLARAASVWDPSIGLGTVSHQNIGYLWPMGPWYWLLDAAGAPDWVAQRLWLATVLFAAGAGTYLLLRRLGLGAVGAAVGAFAYQLSPYLLTYAARISAILLPWAGLPWLLLFTMNAQRRGGWRWPAAIALLVTTIGSINASSVLYVAIAAGLWLLPWRRSGRVIGRIAVLTAATQLWWVVALALSGTYGPPVLETTETLEAVSASSVTSEVLRSLGNWFFYGADAVGPWVEAAVDYQTEGWLIAATFVVPAAAFASAAVVRWAHRTYFLLLVVVGGVVAVAAHPYDSPSPLGALTKLAADSSTFALALRNAQRATPLLALGLAALLGAGVHAVGARVHRGDLLAAVAAFAVVALAMPPLWSGGLVDPNLRRPETLPEWNTEAARRLDRSGTATRVLELPGSDFAAHRWGNTVDPVLPGLLDRPWVGREAAPQGTAGSISLVTALDRRLQEGVLEAPAVAPVARFLSAGDVVVRGDLETERYRTPRPAVLRELSELPPPGLRAPVELGVGADNRPRPALPLVDEIALGPEHASPDVGTAALTLLGVESPRPIVSVVRGAGPSVVLAGDGEGIVEAAAAGLLDGRESLSYGPDVPGASAGRAALVVTDTNRRRAQRFTQLRENYGYTEVAGERPWRADAADARLDLFPGAGDAARTVTVLRGASSVQATGYGNTITYVPEERPLAAFDGDPSTAWRVGAFESPVGHALRVDLGRPVHLDRIRLTQPLGGDRNRWITRVSVRVGERTVEVDLDDRSRRPGGQEVELPGTRRVRVVELRVVADNVGRRADYLGLSAVGFAEVEIPGVTIEEWVRPPTALLAAVGPASADRELAFVFARLRANPAEPVRADPERAMARLFALPSARRFSVTATVRLSDRVDDAAVDRLLGIDERFAATSSSRLPGSLASRASSALDGDDSTAWTPAFAAPGDPWIDVVLPAPATVDRLDLRAVDDGRHSVPRRVRVEAGGESRTVETGSRVTFAPLRGSRFRVTFLDVDARTTVDYFSRQPIALPIAVAELGLGDIRRPPLPAALPGQCREGLLAVDGRPVGLRLRGSTADAVRRVGIAAEPCVPDVDLAPGEHGLRTAPGAATGLDVDRVVLRSAAGGAPAATATPIAPAADEVRSTATRTSRSSHRLTVGHLDGPAQLVLGESFSTGWRARVRGGPDLGPPRRVNGYANGWTLDPQRVGRGPLTVELTWTPQRAVRGALGVSAAGVLVCVVLLLLPPRRHRDAGAPPPPAGAKDPGRRQKAAVVAGAAVVAAIVAGPAYAPAAAVVALGALARPRSRLARSLPCGVAVVAVAACGVGTVLLQVRHGYPPGFTWAANLDRLHPIGWVALVAAGVDAAASWPSRHREPPSPEAPLKVSG